MTFIEPMLRHLDTILVGHFRGLWVALTLTAAIGVASAAGRPVIATGRTGSETSPARVGPRAGTPGNITALALLAVFLTFYVAVILAWENFTHYDDEYFTLVTLRGANIGPPINLQQGRFFPLGFQEFNLLRHFTSTISGYHLLPIAQLLFLSGILITLDDELSIAARAALTILALSTPSILVVFTGLIYPERNVLFFLACLVLSVKRFGRNGSLAWAAAAAVSAQVVLYSKETAFLLILGFAGGRLVFRCRNGSARGLDFRRLYDRESRLDLGLLALALLFLFYYLAVMGFRPSTEYAVLRQQPLLDVFRAYLRLDVLAWLLVAVVFARMYLILRRRAAPLPSWDGLALGGAACLLAYHVLRLFNFWYLAPVDLIAVLYVGRFVILSLGRSLPWRRALVSMLALFVLFQSTFFSMLTLFERKNDIRAKAEMAHLVEAQYRLGGSRSLSLFFPFANPYVIMLFASYLSYHGIPVEGGESPNAQQNAVALVTPAIAEDGLCVEYVRFRCRAAHSPTPGDLVIVLPDDEASSTDATAYRARGERLFSYEPSPPIPRSLHGLVADLVGDLRMTSPLPAQGALPDRWMDGSVTKWK